MNVTEIYTSRKLESIVPAALIRDKSLGKYNALGKWNATVFFVSRKKCLLITNSITRYSVFIAGVRKADFENLTEIFINTLIEQLKADNIPSKGLDIRRLIGEITLRPTDNDRRILGTQKYIIENIDDWKYEFGAFENWNFRDINKRVNGIPYKQLGWLFPCEKMKIVLDKIANF